MKQRLPGKRRVGRVRLDRIVTRSGDGGVTSLAGGARVSKVDPRIEAVGSIDELNCFLGLLRGRLKGRDSELIAAIQGDLLLVGAGLVATPAGKKRLAPLQVDRLEAAVSARGRRLAPFRGFVLPGGSSRSALCHVARSVCRRAERRVVAVVADGAVAGEAIRYLNRLSDLLYIMACQFNSGGRRDIYWQAKPDRGERAAD